MQNAQRRPGTLTIQSRRPQRQPQKPKAWSHQDELQDMRGRDVLMTDNTGQSSVVRLLEADQFALKVKDSQQSILIVWKHDLSSIALNAEAAA